MDLLPPDEVERAFHEQKRREAALVLANASVEASHKLVAAMDSDREDIALKATMEVLDRTGLGKAPAIQIDLSSTTVNVGNENIVEELHARLDRLAGRSVQGEIAS